MHNPRGVAANANKGKHTMAAGVNGTHCDHCSAMVYHLATAVAFTCPYCRTTQLAYPHVTGCCNPTGAPCLHA